LVNEWYQFVDSGQYQIEVGLASAVSTQSGKSVEPVKKGEVQRLQIHKRNSAQLKYICHRLTQTILTSSDAEAIASAALALSYVQDPLAVSYLQAVLRKGTSAWQYAIPGLGRISDESAIDTLISILAIQDPEEGSSLARFVLQEIKERVKDRGLREKITEALELFEG
jgi:hypothetical protein